MSPSPRLARSMPEPWALRAGWAYILIAWQLDQTEGSGLPARAELRPLGGQRTRPERPLAERGAGTWEVSPVVGDVHRREPGSGRSPGQRIVSMIPEPPAGLPSAERGKAGPGGRPRTRPRLGVEDQLTGVGIVGPGGVALDTT